MHGFQYLVGSGGGPPYRSMADALLHGYRQKRAGSARQCRADADTGGGAAPLHGGHPWFFKEEGKLGSIEPGKLGDVVVISDDFFDEKRVPDEAIKRLQSVLTIVGGRVVYDALR